MKHLFYSIMVVLFVPLSSIAQTKKPQEENKNITVITANTGDPMILYVINNKYYLGDIVDILIRRLDVSKVRSIEQVKDKEGKLKYLNKTGKFSKKIQDVFVIETQEEFKYKLKK